jgi:hypothetical protein
MTLVATAASIFVCSHGLPMTVSPVQQLLTVDGQAVVLQSDLLRATFACTVPATASSAPCTAVLSVDGGLSTTLMVGGEAVALATVTGSTTGLPAKPFQITSVNQSKLEAA